MGGKHPSEYNGCKCSVCGVRLPPCKKWDNIKRVPINREVDSFCCYVFLGGRYYRPVGGDYYCPTCFWKPRDDYRRVLEENLRREEERKREEEERLQREEEQRRQAEKLRQELERREEETRREREREEQLKKEQERREAERIQKQQDFDKKVSEKESLADRFAKWSHDKETKQNVRKQVRAETYHETSTMPHSDAQTNYNEIYEVDYELWSDEDLYIEEDESYKYEGDLTEEEVIESVMTMVQEWNPDENEEIDVPWLKIAQTQLISSYAGKHGLSDMEVETLAYYISMIRYRLNDNEMLVFTKLLCLLAKTHPLDYEKTTTTLDDELPGRFMILLLKTALNNGFIDAECANECIKLLASTTINDKELVKLISETKSVFWNAHDWLVFMLKCDEVQLSYTDQKKIMVLVQAYDISPVVLSNAVAKQNPSEIMETLVHYIDNEPNTHIVDLLKQIRSSKLIENETLDQVEDITKKTKTILESFNIDLDYEQRLSSDLANAKEVFAKCSSGNVLDHDQLASALSTLCCAVKKSQCYCPRDTLLITLTILIVSGNKSIGRVLEVMTGEGKSTVISMFAAILAIQGKHVDIITSSPILALRDAEEWETFYSIMGLEATHNTDIGNSSSKGSDLDKRKTEIYKHPIIYGTLGNFAADVLHEEFELKQIRSGRRFDVVIADEVDMLMLDEGVQFTYLSHDSPVLHHLQPVIAIVWAVIGQYIPVITTVGHAYYMGGAKLFSDIIFESINPEICSVDDSFQFLIIANEAGLIDEQTMNMMMFDDDQSKQEGISESKKQAMSTITNDTIIALISKLEEYLPYNFEAYTINEAGQPDPCYMSTITEAEEDLPEDEQLPIIRLLLLGNGLACTLISEQELKEGATAKIENSIEFTAVTRSNDDEETSSKLQIPEFLKELVINQLPDYINSAFRCLEMVENREYTISQDNRVIPVDFLNSGVMQMNKKWGQGLQQMLEMKHKLCISPMSVVTNFMSHVELFMRYRDKGTIYGLSGTLGIDSPDTGKLLKELYKVHPCTIPTFKHRKLFENPAIIVEGGKQQWYEEIMGVLNTAVKQETWYNGRAVLVLCEDIKTALDLKMHILDQENWSDDKVHLYAHSDSDELQAIQGKFGAGEIIIATNLAGRGTNVKVTKEVNKSGGLLCLVTFLPRNRRVELQAFGRTARKGDPGSVQCVLHASSLAPQYRGQSITKIRELRAIVEADRLDLLMSTEVKEVQVKETLFKLHCRYLSQINAKIAHRNDKSITIDSINENWGQWLLMKREKIELQQVHELMAELASIQHESQWPVINFYDEIKYGNNLLKYDEKKNAKEAHKHFSNSIDQESIYGAIAYYNRAYLAIVRSGKGYMDSAMADLREADNCLEPYITEVASVIQCVAAVSQVQPQRPVKSIDVETEDNEQQELAADVFTKQMQVRIQIFGFVRDKIRETLEKLQKFKDNGDNVEAEALGIFSLIPEADYAINLELFAMWHLGMEIVFSVRKKPKFCWEGLIVILLGVAEIVAGVALSVLTAGAAANLGMGLIAEGVSDCIDGVIAMATGEFSWAEWGITKAISIATSLVSGGVAKFATKGLKATKTASKIGKELKSIPKVAKSTWGSAATDNLKQVLQHVGSEVVEQSVMRGIGYGQQQAMKLLYDRIGAECKSVIIHDLHKSFMNGYLGEVVQTEYISKLPESYAIDDKMSPALKQSANEFFEQVGFEVIGSLMSDATIQTYVTEASLTLISKLSQKHPSGKALYEVLEAVTVGALVTKAVADVSILLNKLVPETEKVCHEFLSEQKQSSKQDDIGTNSQLKCAATLKNELANYMGDIYGDLVSSSLQQNLSAVASSRVHMGVSRIGHNALRKLLRSGQTETLIRQAQRANYMRSMDPKDYGGLPPVAQSMIKGYATRISDVSKAGSILEMKIAAEHYKQGVTIYHEKNGKFVKHSSIIPSNGDSSSNVKVLFTPPKNKDGIGHYDLIVDNKVIKIQSDDSNCLFQAYATGRNPQHNDSAQGQEQLKSDALDVRRVVANEINENPGLWAEHVTHRLELTRIKTGERFALLGAGKKNIKTKIHANTFYDMVHKKKRHTIYTQANGVRVQAVKTYKKNLAVDSKGNLMSADGTRETPLVAMITKLEGMNLVTNQGRCVHTLFLSGMPKRVGGKAKDSATSFHIGPSEAGANAGNAYGNAVMTSSDLNKKERKIWNKHLKSKLGPNNFTVVGKIEFEPLIPSNFNQFFTDLNAQRIADGKPRIHPTNKNALKKRLLEMQRIDSRAVRVKKIDYEITDSSGNKHFYSLNRDLELFVPKSFSNPNQSYQLPGENLAASYPKVKRDRVGKIPGRKPGPIASATTKTQHDQRVDAYKKANGIP